MSADPKVVAAVQKELDDRVVLIRTREGMLPMRDHATLQAVEQSWALCLEGIGARRVGKLMGIITQPEQGVVRLKDPLGNGGNYGFVEMDEESFNKVATLGLP